MNKRHIEQLRQRSREEAQKRQKINGEIVEIKFTKRKINRARRAVFEFTFKRSEDGKIFNLLVPYSLKARCWEELSGEISAATLEVEIAPMSPDGGYRRKNNEFELTDFKLITA